MTSPIEELVARLRGKAKDARNWAVNEDGPRQHEWLEAYAASFDEAADALSAALRVTEPFAKMAANYFETVADFEELTVNDAFSKSDYPDATVGDLRVLARWRAGIIGDTPSNELMTPMSAPTLPEGDSYD